MSEVILQTQELTRRYGHTVALDRASITVKRARSLVWWAAMVRAKPPSSA